jgi:hypothetical protein
VGQLFGRQTDAIRSESDVARSTEVFVEQDAQPLRSRLQAHLGVEFSFGAA